MFVKLLWGHAAVALLLAFWYGTFAEALLIGVPTALLIALLANQRPGAPVVRDRRPEVSTAPFYGCQVTPAGSVGTDNEVPRMVTARK